MMAACSCSRPIKDSAFLCSECSKTLEKHLAEVPALAADLETTRTRTSRTGGRGIGIVVRDAERPVPWNDKAARLADEFKALLVGWARICQDFRVRPEGPACRRCAHSSCSMLRSYTPPVDTAQSLSAYLLASLPALRHRPEVTAMADELYRFRERAAKVIDRPAERTYAGPCREEVEAYGDHGEACCLAELHVSVDERTAVCPYCAAEHDVAIRKQWLLAVAESQLVTVAELVRLLAFTDQPVPRATVDSWVRRRRLVQHGSGEPALYRVGDALSLLVERKSASA
jgi:hypothetical protein